MTINNHPEDASSAQQARKIIRSDDSALLQFNRGVLYNNVFNKGDITNAFQQVFLDGTQPGWEWDWPSDAGPHIKAYPEVILGRSPWCGADYASVLPDTLDRVKPVLDFVFSVEAEGSWADSFDFWITNSPRPAATDITCNLCIWIKSHRLEPNYAGRQESVTIGGVTYAAVIETPEDQPAKSWKTLFVIAPEPKYAGSLDLRPFLDVLLDRSLAKPDHYLATAELGSEVAYGKGKTVVNRFGLR